MASFLAHAYTIATKFHENQVPRVLRNFAYRQAGRQTKKPSVSTALAFSYSAAS